MFLTFSISIKSFFTKFTFERLLLWMCSPMFTQISILKNLVEMENVRNMNVCIMRECIYMWVLSQNILPKWKHDWTGTYILKCNCCNNWLFWNEKLIEQWWTHYEQMLFKCKLCKKRFSWNGKFKEHECMYHEKMHWNINFVEKY